MRAAFVVLLCVCLALVPTPKACAGAYTLPQGEAKIFVTGLATDGDHYYDRMGRLKSRSRLTKWDLQFFGEYGLTNKITLLASTALERITVNGPDRARRSGFGRSEFGVRVKMFEADGWIVSTQSSIIVAGARNGRGPAVVGETDDQIDVRMLVARSFTAFDRPVFVDVQAGYRTRSGDPADEFRLDATIGVRAWPSVLLLLQSFNTFGRDAWLGPYPLVQRIHKVQAGVLYDVDEAIQLYAAAFMTPDARDALDERGAILGIGYRF